MARVFKRSKVITVAWVALVAAAGIFFSLPSSYSEYTASNSNSGLVIIPQAAQEWKKPEQMAVRQYAFAQQASQVDTPPAQTALLNSAVGSSVAGVKVVSPVQGVALPFRPVGRSIPLPQGTNNKPAPVQPPEAKNPPGADTLQIQQLNILIAAYRTSVDQNAARAALNDIVNFAKANPGLKEIVGQKLHLDPTSAKIWNEFDILVISTRGGKEFTGGQLNEIYSVLNSLPKEAVKSVNVITTALASEASNTLLGFTYADADYDVIVLNTRSTYFYGARGLYTFAQTLTHEAGHRVQLALSPEQQKEFYDLHLASGDNVLNYARSYGMKDYGAGDIGYEDFATMYEAWCSDSAGILARARAQAAQGLPLLLEKVKFILKLFAHSGADGKLYTYVYQLNANGFIYRREVLLGSDGLPVL